ncbi:MAG: dTDP-4-amino-4,6-dideoxygalactose transaminase [Chitinophagales bacterium]|nr:dTDP-4-amino-4,6-dideoxygalactose transaminase [Chitinophagales bacterium]
MIVPLHTPTLLDEQDKYIRTILANPSIFRDRIYSAKCIEWLLKISKAGAYLTKSCTQSLELAAQLLNFQAGDEVILPSYGFVSTANAFASQGAKCKFIDIRPDTMNIDENLIEQAITEKTRAIITINYSGVGCNYDVIIPVAKKHNLILIEDNAHGILAKYKGEYLGRFGDISTNSFDHLKNISCGEGGAILFNNKAFEEQIKIRYEFGTNKLDFIAGKVSSYEWKGVGSNYYLSDLLSAFLLVQLENAHLIIERFKTRWNQYRALLSPLADENLIRMPSIGTDFEHNGHLFYIFTKSKQERAQLIEFLKNKGIATTFHYTPLHSSEFGKKNGSFCGEDVYTTRLSETLLRLPLFYALKEEEATYVARNIFDFYGVDFHP